MTKTATTTNRPCILLGAGGHARVVADLASALGWRIDGVCDPQLHSSGTQAWNGHHVLGGDEYLFSRSPDSVYLLLGIGKIPGRLIRSEVFLKFKKAGFVFPPLIHPAAWVSTSAVIEDGAQIMAGVVVQAGARIGQNTIINTKASVDHDSIIGEHCHVAPGSTLCGDVTVGEHTFIGAGATIIQGVTIGASQFIKAGTLITHRVQ